MVKRIFLNLGHLSLCDALAVMSSSVFVTRNSEFHTKRTSTKFENQTVEVGKSVMPALFSCGKKEYFLCLWLLRTWSDILLLLFCAIQWFFGKSLQSPTKKRARLDKSKRGKKVKGLTLVGVVLLFFFCLKHRCASFSFRLTQASWHTDLALIQQHQRKDRFEWNYSSCTLRRSE